MIKWNSLKKTPELDDLIMVMMRDGKVASGHVFSLSRDGCWSVEIDYDCCCDGYLKTPGETPYSSDILFWAEMPNGPKMYEREE